MYLVTEHYPVYFEKDSLPYLKEFLEKKCSKRQVFVLTDTNTREHCWPKIVGMFEGFKPPKVLTVPAGEPAKNFDTVQSVWKQLLEMEARRDALFINLGGGMISDLGGLAASLFKRGLPFIHIPTSLLGMLDASVGGKTGVDFLGHKNMVGLFSNPEAVFIWDGFLETLPKEQRRSGMAEAFKHALIDNNGYWCYLKKSVHESLSYDRLIFKSLEIKKKIVGRDPKEGNERKKLNFGHTIAHAIESYALATPGHPPVLHGDAVAAGMIAESYISWKMNQLSKECLDEIRDVLGGYFPRIAIQLEQVEPMLQFMANDKKNTAHTLNFTLLDCLGGAVVNQQVPAALVRESLNYYASL